MRKYVSPTLLATLIAFLGTGVVRADDVVEEAFEETATVSPNGLVSLSNTNGHVSVEAWDRNEVLVSATKRARGRDAGDVLRDIRIEVSEHGGDVTIDTDLPRSRGWFRGTSASVEYEVKVPATVRLRLKSTNGQIEVEGVGGDVELRTTNGGIRARDLGGRLDAETTNGKIDAEGVAGPIDAETTNGTIHAEIIGASLDDDVSLSTTNGAVELSLAASVSARIDARAGNGSVRSELPVRGIEREKRNELSGDLNGGGAMIRIRTSNGSIRIREL